MHGSSIVVVTARQLRWLGIAEDSEVDVAGLGGQGWQGERRHMRRGAVGTEGRAGGYGWGCQMWVPLSVMVAALPACESPSIGGAGGGGHDGGKRELMARRVKECERRAYALSSRGMFVAAVEAVEENLVLRTRMGTDSPQELVCMLQSVAYLCNAYAVECVSRLDHKQARVLVDKAVGLTRKKLLKKCKVTELVRVGLRAATFNTAAFVHSSLERGSAPSFRYLQRALLTATTDVTSDHSCVFRYLQRALLAVRRHRSGLEVVEAATLVNMSALLIAQGNVDDAVTVTGAAADLVATLAPETKAAWDREFASPSEGCSGRSAGSLSLSLVPELPHKPRASPGTPKFKPQNPGSPTISSLNDERDGCLTPSP